MKLTFRSVDFNVSIPLVREDMSRKGRRQKLQVSHQALVAGVQSQVQLERLAVVEAAAALLANVLVLRVNVLL